jgi:hypothetical protein
VGKIELSAHFNWQTIKLHDFPKQQLVNWLQLNLQQTGPNQQQDSPQMACPNF